MGEADASEVATSSSLATGSPSTPSRPTAEGPPVHNPLVAGIDGVLASIDQEGMREAVAEQTHRKQLEKEDDRARQRTVPGIDKEDFDAMLRAFDKHVQHVHSVPPTYDGHLPRGLDIQMSMDEEFSVDRMTSTLERLYTSVGTGLVRATHEVQRIRNWEDGGYRSTIALSIYCYAWWCEAILFAFFAFASILVLVPSSRSYFFDAPLYMGIDLSDADYMPKDRWSPAEVEQRSADWADKVMKTAAALSGQGDTKSFQEAAETRFDKQLQESIDRRGSSEEDEDKSKKDKAIDLYARPALRIIGSLADKWERIANALNPQPSWVAETRLKTVWGWLVAPGLLLSLIVTERMVVRALGVGFGIVLFAQPLISRTITELDRTFPDWKERIVLLYNILDTVPTNTQLVFRVLRRAEHRAEPVPCPAKVETPIKEPSGRVNKMRDGLRHKARRIWDKIGAKKEKSLAVVTGYEDEGVSRFYVWHGKHGPGFVVLHPPDIETHLPARIEFTTVRDVSPANNGVTDDGGGYGGLATHHPRQTQLNTDHLVVSINDIVSLRKTGKRLPVRIAVGWALDAEGAGGTGLEIGLVRRQERDAVEEKPGVAQGREEVLRFSGIVRRDELFDRLLCIGDQRWETK